MLKYSLGVVNSDLSAAELNVLSRRYETIGEAAEHQFGEDGDELYTQEVLLE